MSKNEINESIKTYADSMYNFLEKDTIYDKSEFKEFLRNLKEENT